MKYIAKSTLAHKGQIIKEGEEVDLTQKQADALGDKVERKNTKSSSSSTSKNSKEDKEEGPTGYKANENESDTSQNNE